MSVAVEEICARFEGRYKDFARLPQFLAEASKDGNSADGVTLITEGREWAFAFIQQYQPKTYEVLMSGTDFELIFRRGLSGYLINVVMEVQGQAIEVVRQTYGFNSSDDSFPAKAYAGKRALSLPEPIRMAYYHRIDGLNIPNSVGMGPFTRILPYPISRPWPSINIYLGDLRLKKKLLPIIEERFSEVRPMVKGSTHAGFDMFLNSWGSFIGNKRTDGDHLFVRTKAQDGVVYYIRDADVANMMILADPVEAIDRYCEHVLLRKAERFDFRPWAVPFVAPDRSQSSSA